MRDANAYRHEKGQSTHVVHESGEHCHQSGQSEGLSGHRAVWSGDSPEYDLNQV